jgi:hypothetical protein
MQRMPNSADFGPFTLRRVIVSPRTFVDRWEPLYEYPLEHLYSENIGKPLTSARTRLLFEWKNGGRLSRLKQESVERNYIGRLQELDSLRRDTSAAEFLERFNEGGAIWRIYFLHLWAPESYPIYDQHVHRAMSLIQTGRIAEIPASDPAKISEYLNRYLPFHATFDNVDLRRTDRALWACGKYMKGLARAPLD